MTATKRCTKCGKDLPLDASASLRILGYLCDEEVGA